MSAQRPVKRGKKPGVGKARGEFDLVRLIEGDSSAALAPEDRNRIRTAKAALRGNVLDYIRAAVGDSKHDALRAAALDAVFWLMGEVLSAALCKQDPLRVTQLIFGLCATDNPVPAEREIAKAVAVAMATFGDSGNRRIYATQADLKKWIRRCFPNALCGAKDGGRSTPHQALNRWGITCSPR